MKVQRPGRTNGPLPRGNAGPPVERRASAFKAPICLLPGPVALPAPVHAAFQAHPVYHRGDDFRSFFGRVRGHLSDLVGGKPAAVLVGSGTLANDAIAAVLAAEKRGDVGLILAAGEFGDRLVKQARRWGLNPKVLAWEWGRPWQLDEVEAELRQRPAGGWIWGVHHETSTGVLNDLPGFVALARKYGQRVCADCVSSIGTVPVDLTGVYLASGTSGKALRSYAGLAFVYGDPAELTHIEPHTLPTYFDVPAALASPGPRFTVPSSLVLALDAALDPLASAPGRVARFAQVSALGRHLRQRLMQRDFIPLAAEADANPSVVTFAPPAGISASEFVSRCHEGGYLVAGQSGYLAERQLVQIAVMGAVSRDDIDGLMDLLPMS